MSDVAVNASQVAKVGTGSQVFSGNSGVAHNAGDVLYQNNDNTQQWFKANCSNALTAGSFNGLAFSAQGASGAGQPITLQRTGTITLGTGVLAVGEHYVLSNTSGKIGPTRDRLVGDYDSYMGYAADNTNLSLPPGGPLNKTVARTVNA